MLIVAKWLGQPGKENKEKTTEVITYALWNALTNLNLTIPIWNHMNGLFLNRSFNPCFRSTDAVGEDTGLLIW